MSDSRSSDNTDLRDQAIAILKKKREFWNYLGVWVGVNALLNGIWWFTTPDGYYWPLWPALGMALAVPLLWRDAFGRPTRHASEDRIQSEIRRLKDR